MIPLACWVVPKQSCWSKVAFSWCQWVRWIAWLDSLTYRDPIGFLTRHSTRHSVAKSRQALHTWNTPNQYHVLLHHPTTENLSEWFRDCWEDDSTSDNKGLGAKDNSNGCKQIKNKRHTALQGFQDELSEATKTVHPKVVRGSFHAASHHTLYFFSSNSRLKPWNKDFPFKHKT